MLTPLDATVEAPVTKETLLRCGELLARVMIAHPSIQPSSSCGASSIGDDFSLFIDLFLHFFPCVGAVFVLCAFCSPCFYLALTLRAATVLRGLGFPLMDWQKKTPVFLLFQSPQPRLRWATRVVFGQRWVVSLYGIFSGCSWSRWFWYHSGGSRVFILVLSHADFMSQGRDIIGPL